MNDMLHDYLIIDGTEEAEDAFEYAASLQRQINSGLIWRMQGSCGRAAMDAIESGACVLGPQAHADYWGNVVPARDQVKPGTKGSLDYSRERHGADWAERIAAI